MSTYWEKYKERYRTEDKHSYVTYLESQLDRVCKSASLIQSFSDTIDKMQSQLNAADEKISNLTRLMKLQQSYVQSQEQQIQSLKQQPNHIPPPQIDLSSLQSRLLALEQHPSSPSPNIEIDIETKIVEINTNFSKRIQEIADVAWNAEQVCLKLSEDYYVQKQLSDKRLQDLKEACAKNTQIVENLISLQKQEEKGKMHKPKSCASLVVSPRFTARPESSQKKSNKKTTKLDKFLNDIKK